MLNDRQHTSTHESPEDCVAKYIGPLIISHESCLIQMLVKPDFTVESVDEEELDQIVELESPYFVANTL